MLADKDLVLFSTAKPLPMMNIRWFERKIKRNSRAEVTLHAPFGLTLKTRDWRKKKLDIGCQIGPIKSLILWVINVVDINDGHGAL